MTGNLLDKTVKHQVFLLRKAGSTAKQLLSFVNTLKVHMKDTIENYHSENLTKLAYQRLFTHLNNQSKQLSAELNISIKTDMTDLAVYEGHYTQKIVDSAIAPAVNYETVLPSDTLLITGAFTNVVDKVPGINQDSSLSIGNILSKVVGNATEPIIQSVREGIVLGKTTAEIASDISLYDSLSKFQAMSVARTITNHVASQARRTFYEENKDIINGYQVIAVLDDRTTETCQALDGQVFPVDDFEEPPYHWNCRSTFIGVIDPELGVKLDSSRSSIGDEGPEQVDGNLDYNTWLGQQSNAFQKEVLGPTKYDLFQQGIPVQKFVDENYKPLTLEELKALDSKHS
jgi:SPP1 gp7 family putative phage head morphogenesis protein